MFLKSFYKIEHDELGLLLSLFGLESVVFVVFVVGLSGKSFDTSVPFHAKFCLVMSWNVSCILYEREKTKQSSIN